MAQVRAAEAKAIAIMALLATAKANQVEQDTVVRHHPATLALEASTELPIKLPLRNREGMVKRHRHNQDMEPDNCRQGAQRKAGYRACWGNWGGNTDTVSKGHIHLSSRGIRSKAAILPVERRCRDVNRVSDLQAARRWG